MSPLFHSKLINHYAPAECIDASNLHCPLPLLKLKQGLHHIKTNECIYIITTDVNSPSDISRYCDKTDFTLLLSQAEQTHTHLIVKK